MDRGVGVTLETIISAGEERSRSVLFEPDGLSIAVRAGESILAALQRQGYTHAVGCRRGGCGRCKVSLVSGQVGYSATVAPEVLPPAERDEWCLSCRAEPATDVVVRLRPQDRLTCLIPWAKPTLASKEPPQ